MQYMIALAALILWPVVALFLYMSMPVGRATIWTILGGYLLLPIMTSFDFPGIPSLDKSSIPSLAAMCLAPMLARGREFRWPRSNAVNLLMLLYVLTPFGTMLNNGAPIIIGTLTLPGLGVKESFSAAAANAIEIIPFVLGASLLNTEKGHRDILKAFVLASLFYSILMLFEIRFSPILQGRIYGISNVGAFLQQIRDGGFRSMVFLGHGLLVSTFCATALLAAIGLWRMRISLLGLPAPLIIFYLAVILALNKSVGAVLLILLLAPLFLFLRSKRFLEFAAVLALIVFIYPAVRSADILPMREMVPRIRQLSEARAHSFEFRLNNEELLLGRAEQKPFFGWGSYGRNRVLVQLDGGDTRDVSVTDGTWIITLGIFGWVGYVARFGLLTYPFLRAYRLRRYSLPTATMALLAMHLLNLLDLIPNSSLRPITWLAAGALASMSLASLGVPGRLRRPVPQSATDAAGVAVPA